MADAHGRARAAACAAALALLAGAVRAGAGESSAGPEAPFAARDQNPLLRPFYLPSARLAPLPGFDGSIALAWSNTVNLPSTDREQLHVDEETAEVDLRATWRRDRWLAAVELPLAWRGGGILDGVIDDFHRLIGFNGGDRQYVPSNAYRIAYHATGAPGVVVARGGALGDVPVEVGRLLHESAGTELALWAGLKLPTGSRDHATGSGATDLAAWLSAGHRFGSRLSVDAQAGLMRTGGSGEFTHVARIVEFGTLSIIGAATRRVSIVAQADVHSALPASELAFLRPAVIGALGARVRLGPALALDAGIQEDLVTNHSPDATFYVALHRAR